MDSISVILPVYNCEAFVHDCLHSLEAQSFKSFEVIMIDDCSTDNTSLILQEFAKKDKRFKYFRNEKNLKLSASRNKGIVLAKGEYIFFIDADDILDSLCLEKLFTSLKKNQADVSICEYKSFVNEIPQSESAGSIQILDNFELMKEVGLCKKIQNFAWGKLFKRELFEDVAFPIGRTFEDVYIIPLVLSKTKKCVFLQEHLYFYRQNSSSISNTLNLKKIQDFFLSMEQKGYFFADKYPQYLYYLSQSFFELFFLLKEYKIKKKKILNYSSVKNIYRRIVAKASFKQKIKYIVAVI